jgi:predicted nicotinamide N-methyase
MSSDSDSENEVEYEDEKFQIRDFEFKIITVAYMPISKLMRLRENSSEISGQKLWCGSLTVIEYLLDHPEFISNSNVIELGSGTGVVGMLCGKLGCRNVCLTDNDTRSLEHMRLDVIKNGVNAMIIPLDWFSFDLNRFESACHFFLELHPPLRIVAGDVLYKEALVQPFFQVVKAFLQRPNSKMLLCHVPRAGVEHSHVIAIANQCGLSITSIPAEEWKKGVCVQYSVAEDYDRAQLYLLENALE